MAIVGTETITVISNIQTGTDPDYDHPIFEEIQRDINRVLVQHSSSIIEYQLHQVALDIDITVYLNPREIINLDDKVIYQGRIYKQSGKSVLWKPFRGSRLKPKLILFLKAND